MNIYDQALELFVGTNIDRECFLHPFKQGANNYATDAKSIIRIATHLCEEKYETLEKPNSEYVMNKAKNRDKLFSYDGLCQTLLLVPKVNFELCDACGGEGEVQYEFEYDGKTYYRTNDCPVCCGTGQKALSMEIRDHRYGIKFEPDEYPITQDQLSLLIATMKLLKVSTARLVYADPQTHKFELGKDVEVMFCGYIPSSKFADLFVCCKGEEP